MNFKYDKNKDWYIHDIQCSSKGKRTNIGKYGRIRERFLKEHRHSLYNHLVASEEIINHLTSIDREARKQINMHITQLASEEIVINELIYS